MRTLVHALAALVGTIAIVACSVPAVGVASGVGLHAFADGELWGTAYGSIDQAYDATTIALLELGLHVVQEARATFGAHIVATEPRGRDVTIDLVPEGERVTRIGVRVGTIGDERAARAILRRIELNL